MDIFPLIIYLVTIILMDNIVFNPQNGLDSMNIEFGNGIEKI